MNTFIFLGCVLPVRYLVDNTRFILLQKLYLTKKILIFWYEKNNIKLPSQRMSLGVFGVKKVTFLGREVTVEDVFCVWEITEPLTLKKIYHLPVCNTSTMQFCFAPWVTKKLTNKEIWGMTIDMSSKQMQDNR